MAYSTYYRHKLSPSLKEVYDRIVEGLEKRQRVIVVPRTPSDELSKINFAVDYDNPQLFYVDFRQFTYTQYDSSTWIEYTYLVDAVKLKEIENKIATVTDEIVRRASYMSLKDASLFLHDWIVSHCKYSECEDFPQAGHNIVGVFIYSKSVCEGMAKAYKYLADLIRMRCMVVTGKAVHPDGSGGGHAWNLIKLDKNFYHIDVTFDGLIESRFYSRAYYLLSTKQITVDHTFDTRFEIPDCPESANELRTVAGTNELIDYLKSESKRCVTHSEVRLTRGFTIDELLSKIDGKTSIMDYSWRSKIKSYWYGDYNRTLFICWR